MTKILSCPCASVYIQNDTVCTHKIFCHFTHVKIILEHFTNFETETNEKEERSSTTPFGPPIVRTLSDVNQVIWFFSLTLGCASRG